MGGVGALAVVLGLGGCAVGPGSVPEKTLGRPADGPVALVAPPRKPAPPPRQEPAPPPTKPDTMAAPPVGDHVGLPLKSPGSGISVVVARPAPEDTKRRKKGVPTVALPPVPVTPPADADDLAALIARPPIAPPVPAALLVPAGAGPADERCTEATRAAREAVLSALSVPRDRLAGSDWVEPILKVTELSLVACQGDTTIAGSGPTPSLPPPAAAQAAAQAAAYWRATSFLLHGQYARAAVHYRRVAGMTGAYAWLGYSRVLADMLDACAKTHRAAVDTWRLAGLLEARGATAEASRLYAEAAASGCGPLSRLTDIHVRRVRN